MNPLWWLYLRMSGNAWQPAWLGGGYLLVVGALFLITTRGTAAADMGQMYATWLGIVTAGQALFLLLVAPNAITRAVRRDYETGLVESLRQTPLSSATLTLGYLVGPLITLLVLFSTGLLAGTLLAGATASSAGIGLKLGASVFVGGWWGLQVVVVTLSLFICALALLSAVCAQGSKFNIIGLIAFAAIFGGWVAIPFLPALSLLLPFTDVFDLIGSIGQGVTRLPADRFALSALAQVVFAVVFLGAAAIKLRRPEGPLFAMRWALALLGLWLVATVVGHRMGAGLPVQVATDEWRELQKVRVAASVVGTLLVGLFVIQASALAALAAQRRASFAESPAPGRSLPGPLLVGAVAIAVLLLLGGLERADSAGSLALLVTAAVSLSIWMDYSTLYFAHAWRRKVWLILLFTWGGYRIGLVLLDLASAVVLMEPGEDPPLLSALALGSPVGTVFAIFVGAAPQGAVVAGLVVQFALALGLHLVARRARRGLHVLPAASAVPAGAA